MRSRRAAAAAANAAIQAIAHAATTHATAHTAAATHAATRVLPALAVYGLVRLPLAPSRSHERGGGA